MGYLKKNGARTNISNLQETPRDVTQPPAHVYVSALDLGSSQLQTSRRNGKRVAPKQGLEGREMVENHLHQYVTGARVKDNQLSRCLIEIVNLNFSIGIYSEAAPWQPSFSATPLASSRQTLLFQSISFPFFSSISCL